jgi:hypothetical protein
VLLEAVLLKNCLHFLVDERAHLVIQDVDVAPGGHPPPDVAAHYHDGHSLGTTGPSVEQHSQQTPVHGPVAVAVYPNASLHLRSFGCQVLAIEGFHPLAVFYPAFKAE